MDFWFLKWRNKSIKELSSNKKPSLISQVFACIISLALGVGGLFAGGIKFFCIIVLIYSFTLFVRLLKLLLKETTKKDSYM